MKNIDISDALSQFKQHLDENPMTILSAKFGDGKSYFLNEFIKRNESNTFFVTLHPINYSVAQNEDVFEYVKRDILVQLNNAEKLPDIDLEAFFNAFCNWDNIKSIVTFALDFMPHGALCKKILDFADSKYKNYKSKCNTFRKYDNVFKNQKGGLYEDDAYTELIKTTLSAIKNPEEKYKTCLIIEDLDRIDPAHLFRILNVIGAHIDSKKASENKFGFDNIILVMDYDVTGHIFHHFYGEQANYEGYMAKFFSGNPFRYSIQHFAINQLLDLLVNNYNLPTQLFDVEYCSIEGIITNPTLKTRLKELSVRDIERTIDKIESCLIQDIIVDSKGWSFDAKSPMAIYLSVLVLTESNYSDYTLLINLKKTGDDFTKSLGSYLHNYIECNKHYCCSPRDASHSLRISFPNKKIVIEEERYNPDAINLEEFWKSAFYDTIRNINGQVLNNVVIV